MADETKNDLPEEMQELQDLDEKEQQKLKKLMEKDAKTYRSPTGLFKWLVAALGVGLASSLRDRNPMTDGFGLIAFASLTPMIFVMAYGGIIQWM